MTTDRPLLFLALASLASGSVVWANPQGGSVSHGAATVVLDGNRLDITASDNAVLNWTSFNISEGEVTRFLQPGAASIVWNRILDQNPSQILGSLQGNGTVVLFNQSGFYFGPNSVVNVGGLIVTTAAPPPNIGEGGSWQFNGMPPLASIINYGQIQVSGGGSLFLVAEKIENHGVLTAPDGTLGLYAGKEVLISERPDGRGLSAKASLPSGAIDNHGRLLADAGEVALQARVVNIEGRIQADSLRERNGVIELVAEESLQLGTHAEIEARGSGSGTSSGGRITLKSSGAYSDQEGSRISVAGGPDGGDGGKLSISAKDFQGFHAHLDGTPGPGGQGGSVVVDPDFIRLRSSGASGPVGDGTVLSSNPGATLDLNVNTAFSGFHSITLQANQDITLTQSTLWNLVASTGVSEPGSKLTLQAGRNLIFENGSSLIAGNGWSISLESGVNFSANGTIQPGLGSLQLLGNSSLESREGSVHVEVGKDVLVGSGFIRSVEGGSLDVWAHSGDINTGSRADGYDFTAQGYRVGSTGVGGISTAAGGDVRLRAGGDVIAETVQVGNKWPGATGAYGADPGNVTIEAGRNVRGNFLVRNGVGKIVAGQDAGTAGNPLGLNLVNGSWDVFATRDLYLSEVRNPAGTFDSFKRTAPNGERVAFLGDYASDAQVRLVAGDGIALLGQNLPRTTANRNSKPIYPASLSLQAGAGGIEIRESLTLAPSPWGELSIITTDGGSLFGVPSQTQAPLLVMSDSDSFNSLTWPQVHALVPLHLQDTHPTRVSISGNLRDLTLVIPEMAEISVGGNAYNFNYSGLNLKADAVTQIQVAGDLSYRGNRTATSPLNEVPNFAALNPDYSERPDLFPRFSYDVDKKTLSFTGRMTQADYNFLMHPKVLGFDSSGRPLVDAQGAPIYVDAPIPFLASVDQTQLTELFNASQDATVTGAGLNLAGGGKYRVEARNIDLGISEGITSDAPSLGLSALGLTSPDLVVVAREDLSMTASKIAAVGPGGGISITAGGSIDVGGPDSASLDRAKGIFTFGGGSIDVRAGQNVDVNGSRIATYDGGNISVLSSEGHIDAGEGGQGSVTIKGFVTEADGHLREITTTIPGSGILATSLPGGNARPGDVSLVAERGDIRASKGGVVQLAFNNATDAGRIRITALEGNIDAGKSGIIGGDVGLDAPKGAVAGLVVASQNVNITGQSFSGTAFGGGNVSVSASSVSGSVIGGGAVSVSADSVSGAIVGNNVSTSGNTSGAQVGVAATSAASTGAKTDTAASEAVAKVASDNKTEEDEETRRKRLASTPKLTRTVGRVTVLLPNSSR